MVVGRIRNIRCHGKKMRVVCFSREDTFICASVSRGRVPTCLIYYYFQIAFVLFK